MYVRYKRLCSVLKKSNDEIKIINYVFIFQGYDQDDWDSDFDDDNGHAAPMGMSAPSNTGQPQGGHSLAPPAMRNNPQHGSLGDVSSIGRGADSKRSSTKTR